MTPGVNFRPFVKVNGKTYPLKKPYIARPSINGVQVYLGGFATEAEARAKIEAFKARERVAA